MDEEKKKKYALFSDNEWIDNLLKVPADEEAHEYFFKIKCIGFLKFISTQIYKSDNYEELIGELYVLLSDNDWYILRQFKGKNNAQLYSYLSRCATNHFMSTKKREGKNLFVYPDDDKNIIKELNDMSCEEEYDTTTVMIAYEKLDPRDRDVLQQLVVEGKSSMEAAEKLWPYVNSDKDWRDMPAKRVQNTIAMIKHRAIIRLATEISRISY